MDKAESKRLGDATRPAPKLLPQAGAFAREPASDRPPQAVNDDELAWNLVPFPDGWYAAC
jgi:hypothetical protein